MILHLQAATPHICGVLDFVITVAKQTVFVRVYYQRTLCELFLLYTEMNLFHFSFFDIN